MYLCKDWAKIQPTLALLCFPFLFIALSVCTPMTLLMGTSSHLIPCSSGPCDEITDRL
jgi:hypothetical protein